MMLQLSEEGLSRSRAERKERRKERREKRKEKGGGKFFKGVKKVALSGPRNAFLGLIRLNVHNFAGRLMANIKAGKEGQIKAKWEKLGGKWDKLKPVIEKGAQKKPLLDEGFSTEPVTTTASLTATASAVLVALREFLKKAQGAVDAGKDVAGIIKEYTGKKPEEIADPTDDKYKEYYQPEALTTSNTLLYVGVGGLVLFLLMNRKK
jgi:hypothetical protein